MNPSSPTMQPADIQSPATHLPITPSTVVSSVAPLSGQLSPSDTTTTQGFPATAPASPAASTTPTAGPTGTPIVSNEGNAVAQAAATQAAQAAAATLSAAATPGAASQPAATVHAQGPAPAPAVQPAGSLPTAFPATSAASPGGHPGYAAPSSGFSPATAPISPTSQAASDLSSNTVMPSNLPISSLPGYAVPQGIQAAAISPVPPSYLLPAVFGHQPVAVPIGVAPAGQVQPTISSGAASPLGYSPIAQSPLLATVEAGAQAVSAVLQHFGATLISHYLSTRPSTYVSAPVATPVVQALTQVLPHVIMPGQVISPATSNPQLIHSSAVYPFATGVIPGIHP